MRLVHLRVTGFGKVRDSGFSADRKLTAILGPNEAGKTTLLRALLALNDDAPVPEAIWNRSSGLDETSVLVTAQYALAPSDLSDFAERLWTALPTALTVRKRAGGGREYEFDQLPNHPEQTWTRAHEAFVQFRTFAGAELDTAEDLTVEANAARAEINDLLDQIERDLLTREVTVSTDNVETLRALVSAQEAHLVWLDADAVDDMLKAIEPLVAEPRPAELVRQYALAKVPRFELFSDADRGLAHEYPIADVIDSQPRALQNLLSLAGVSLHEILPDPARRTAVATARDRANATLQHVFSNAWRQHSVAVRIDFEGDRLILLVRDIGPDGQTISFDERSDGLRMFVALTAFLATRPGDDPPILLIDEAESRLHWDAQADLVSMLQTSNEVGQILYTTHSPGCLPPDLGTGVIFVQPDAADTNLSTIRRDFWSVQRDGAFGATPILFMMGASAAAFSRLRRAVVAEGPSDMLLLPTLFRAATRQEELDFQVVPGISVTSKAQLAALDETGVRVVYLVDGDKQGDEWKKQLIGDAGINPDRVKSLPKGLAVEDLLDREFYLSVFLRLAGRRVKPSELSLAPGVLKPQLESLCKNEWHIEPPGTIEVAEAILSELDATRPGAPDHQRVPLAPKAGPALRAVHDALVDALNSGNHG